MHALAATNQRVERELKETKRLYMDSLNTIKAMSMQMVSVEEKKRISEMEVM